NAAEPVRADTFTRFLERFAPYGLSPAAHVAAYGLAENTLAVSHHGKRILTVNKKMLQQRRLHIEDDAPRNNNQLRVVSCGRPLAGIDVTIVDPESAAPLGEDRIGEIWISGESRCAGYWGRPQVSAHIFGAEHLRTGDLGFLHEGELYVCGRIKDVIIIRGV